MATQAADRLSRDAYPAGILFEEVEGIYWLRGQDLVRAKQVVGFCCEEDSAGLDGESASYYAQALLEQGEAVAILRGTAVQPLCLRGRRDPATVVSSTIWVAPVLLFGQKELARLTRIHTRRRSAMAATVERFRQELARGNEASVQDVGDLYVIQAGQDWYDIAWDLTAVPEQVVEALAVASHLASRMLRCQLVLPKARRGKKAATRKPALTISEPVTYGQLRFTL